MDLSSWSPSGQILQFCESLFASSRISLPGKARCAELDLAVAFSHPLRSGEAN
jgi:hypothetical protein